MPMAAEHRIRPIIVLRPKPMHHKARSRSTLRARPLNRTELRRPRKIQQIKIKLTRFTLLLRPSRRRQQHRNRKRQKHQRKTSHTHSHPDHIRTCFRSCRLRDLCLFFELRRHHEFYVVILNEVKDPCICRCSCFCLFCLSSRRDLLLSLQLLVLRRHPDRERSRMRKNPCICRCFCRCF